MIVQIIKLKSDLTEEVLLEKANERKPLFEALPGLIQKYYTKLPEEGHYAGVYFWDSMESLMAFRESGLAASIPQAYQIKEPPSIEIMETMFQLRGA